MVDEDTGQLVADRLVHEQRGDGGVDAARQRAQHTLLPDLDADPLDLLLDHGRGRPGGPRAGDAVEEVLQHLLAVRRVHDLRVELDAVQVPVRRLEGGDRGRVGAGGHLGPVRCRSHGIAVAHPARLDFRKSLAQCPAQAKRRLAELARSALDAPTEILRHQLHAVADTEHRHAELVDPRIDLRRVVRVDRGRPAGEDQRNGVLPAQLGRRGAVADELRVHARLADATGDQLRVLAAEVDDQHGSLFRNRQGLRSGERQNLSADSWAPPS